MDLRRHIIVALLLILFDLRNEYRCIFITIQVILPPISCLVDNSRVLRGNGIKCLTIMLFEISIKGRIKFEIFKYLSCKFFPCEQNTVSDRSPSLRKKIFLCTQYNYIKNFGVIYYLLPPP